MLGPAQKGICENPSSSVAQPSTEHVDDVVTTPVFGTRLPGIDYRRRPSAYVVIRNAARDVAVIRTPRGAFLPGGGLDPDESAEAAVRREAHEEAGLVLGPLAPLGAAVEFIRAVDEDAWFEKVCTFYTASVVERGAATERDHELLWLGDDEACALLGHESHRWAIARAVG
jgi:8-oxo-dGTP diphosphatase